MITTEDLIALGFTESQNIFNPDGKKSWTIGSEVTDVCGYNMACPIVYYDIETQRCKTVRHEFSSVSRVCDKVDDVKKFIDCISFLYELEIV